MSGLAERLRYARQSMKLTLDDVESRTSVGASTLSEFENDKREPRLPQLKELAGLYHRTTAFFLDFVRRRNRVPRTGKPEPW